MLVRVFMVAIAMLAGLPTLRAQGEPPAWLAHFSPEHETLMYIADPLPHLQAILEYAPLRQATVGRDSGPIATRAGRPDPEDPLYIRNQLQTYSGFIPTECVIGITARSYQTLNQVSRAYVSGMLMGGANAADEFEEAARYRTVFEDAVRSLRIPEATVFLRMRDTSGARALRSFVGAAFDPLLHQGIGEVKNQRDGFTVELPVSSFADADVIEELLQDFGIGDSGPMLARQLASLTMHIAVMQVDDGIRIILADARRAQAVEPRGLDPATLPPEFAPGAELLFAARWDIAQLKKEASGWLELWESAEDTDARDHVIEWDEEGFFDAMRHNLRWLHATGDTGVARLTRAASLLLTMREHGVPQAETLANDELLSILPAAELWHVDSSAGLGDFVANFVLQFEDQLDKQRMRPARNPNALITSEDIALAWYYDFADLRGCLLHEDWNDAFAAGAAVLISTGDKLRSLDVGFHIEETHLQGSLRDAPILGVALIGRPHSQEDADEHIVHLYDDLLSGLASYFECDSETPEQLTREIEIAPGIKAKAFVPWAPEDEKGKPSYVLALEGDFLPHYLPVGDLFVLSTSPQLTRQILDAKAGRNRAILPHAQHPLIVAGVARPALYSGFYEALVALSKMQWEPGDGSGPIAPPRNRDSFAAVLGLLGDAHWHTEQRPDGNYTRFEWLLAQ